MSRKNRNKNRNRQLPAVGQPDAELRIQRIQSELRAFAGPLPPPEALEHYNQVLPDAAERIIAMAESQHSHRQELEKNVVTSNIAAQKLGTILGFVVAMTMVLGGMWLVHEGKNLAGMASTLTALAALVGVFIYSKHEQQKDLAKKSEALLPEPRR